MKRIISLLLIILILIVPVYAETDLSTFEQLVENDDVFIKKMILGGATLDEVEAFVNDMDEVVYGFKENIFMQDMDAFFITIFLQNIQKEAYINVLMAFDSMFQEEMVYMFSEKKVPESMMYFKIYLFGDKVTAKPQEPETGDFPVYSDPEGDIEPPAVPETTPLPPEPETPFSDVAYSSWYSEAITELYNLKILVGRPDGLFYPDDYIKREEAIKLLVEAFLGNKIDYSQEFGQRAKGKWYHNHFATAEYYAVISGIFDEEEFKDNKYITRQDFASIAFRAAMRADVIFDRITASTDFYDINEFNYYAVEPVTKLQQAGIIKGVGENKFAPMNYVTRAEAANIVYEILTFGN